MSQVIFPTDNQSNGIQTEEFAQGRRFRQKRNTGSSSDKIATAAFALCWISVGLAVPFLPETIAPVLGPITKTAMGAMLVVSGGFFLHARWRNLSPVLEVDQANRCMRLYSVDNQHRQHMLHKIAFDDIKRVFSDASPKDKILPAGHETLVIICQGRPGRLASLTGSSEQIAVVCDYILTDALDGRLTPFVDETVSFINRGKWEFRQRAS